MLTNYTFMKKLSLCIVMLLFVHCNLFAFLSQGNWRWRNNDGTEKTATWEAGQDTAITLTDHKALRLRVDVFNAQSSTKGFGGGLEYATTLNGPWTTLTNAPGELPFILDGNNAYVCDNDTTSAQLTEPGNYTFAYGRIFTISTDHSDSLLANQRKEYEWVIKPTNYVSPNTKYYFRTQTGANETTNLPTLTTAGTFSPPPAILSNGSFEQGLNGWKNQDSNGNNTFALEDTAVFDGNNALRVSVTQPGQSGSLRTTHLPVHFDPGHTYLLRFWAKADVNAANMALSLDSGSNAVTVSYKMYTDWQRYQYAFKPADTSMSISFFYQSNANYVLDDVTLVNDTDQVADVNMTYMWQDNRSGYGWLTADGQESVPLPDGRAAWFFSDTWLGVTDTLNNFTNTDQLVNNDLVAQTGLPPNGTLNTYFTGSSASPTALLLPPTPAGVQWWYWPRDAIVENDTLKILLPEVERSTQNAEPTYANIESIGYISLPDLKVQKIENVHYLGTDQYSVLLQEDTGKYNYAYGSRTVGSNTFATIARYPRNQLSAAVPWQFLSDTSWVTDNTLATSISAHTFGSIVKLGPGNYAALYEPDVSNQLYMMYAPTPWGPWTNNTLVYQIPYLANGITYFPYMHKETANKGVYTLSYSTNTGIPQMLNDKGTYQPHFVKTNVLALSPFTKTTSPVELLSLSGKDTSGRVLLNWVATYTTDDHFTVLHSIDGKNFQTIATVDGADSISSAHYQVTDMKPINGINYYQIAVYDIDNKLTYSNIIQVNTYQTANLITFTAVADGSRVKIDWTTSSELNNPQFVVQRSLDDKTWSALATVAGSGTTDTTHNYEVFDGHPFKGINYYRLQYLLNSNDTTSLVRSVNMLQTLALIVYPNPVVNNVQFELTGYQGNSFNIMLSDMSGRIADKEVLTTNDNELYSLAIKPASGIYILTVTGSGLNKSSKVIIE